MRHERKNNKVAISCDFFLKWQGAVKIKKSCDSFSGYVLSNMLFLMVPSVRSESGHILSEQQKFIFAPEQQFNYKNLRKFKNLIQTTLYDAEFCVDSEFDIKNIRTYRNLELLSKNRFFIFVEFSVSVAASENELCQKLFHIRNL